MLLPTSLDELVTEYSLVDLEDPLSLTDDQVRSLRYFRREQKLTSSVLQVSRADARVTTWVNRLLALEAFVCHHGRLPRENNRVPRNSIDDDERVLADWVKYQRKAATRAGHCEYQRRRLGCVQGFSWNPIADRWLAQFAEYHRFIGDAGRAPRYRSDDTSERRLAAWAAKQRWRARRGTLDAEQKRLLSGLDIWAWS